MKTNVNFDSAGIKIAGNLYYPDNNKLKYNKAHSVLIAEHGQTTEL